ncbi:hypothetical protein [Subtercola sp. YIM 133946]|uniref:hypothetical protein n=1 Tax=Subtercola sp. YIM 133946 TaxID=3118909 RepID=UPI002F936B38
MPGFTRGGRATSCSAHRQAALVGRALLALMVIDIDWAAPRPTSLAVLPIDGMRA